MHSAQEQRRQQKPKQEGKGPAALAARAGADQFTATVLFTARRRRRFFFFSDNLVLIYARAIGKKAVPYFGFVNNFNGLDALQRRARFWRVQMQRSDATGQGRGWVSLH